MLWAELASAAGDKGALERVLDRIIDVAFSPDGKYVLTGSDDKTARLWDAQTGSELRRFQGHIYRVNGVAFSPNGRYVLTGGSDNIARLWYTEYHATIGDLCRRLTRDFTDDERVKYNIPDKEPTCPQPGR